MMTPKSEAELAEIVAQATGPLAVQGGGTRGMALTGDVVSTSHLSGISQYEPGALTLVAQSGTPVAEIEAALAQERQRLAFEPMDHQGLLGTHGTPTIGGVVAGNISGPRRIQAGAARDFALGVRFVDGAGQIIKNGGRVMKNVTGYDLVKLMSGSWGTLGVLSEVSLKVLPIPETQATLVLHGLDVSQAVQAMAAALGSPFDVSGAAHLPKTAQTFVRVEGFETSVAYRLTQLREILAGFGAEMTQAAQDPWADLRDVKSFHDTPGDVWRVSVKPSDAPAVLQAVEAEEAQLDWAGGLIWLRTSAGQDLRARLAGIAGHATLVRGAPGALPVFHPEAPGVALLTQGLRQRFDPRGILNVGLMAA